MKKIFAILNSTFRGLIRQKVLYNVFFLALALLFVGLMASQLAYGRQDRILIHMATASLTFCMVFVAALAGSRLIQDDIDRRIAYLILSRPVSRAQYLAGRLAGLVIFLGLNILLVHFVLAAALRYLDTPLDIALVQNAFLIWIHISWIAILSVAFSFFMGTALTVMSMIMIFFVTQNLNLMQNLLSQSGGAGIAKIFDFLPQGQYFMMDTRVVYHLALTANEMASRTLYGLTWILIFSVFAYSGFKRKNL